MRLIHCEKRKVAFHSLRAGAHKLLTTTGLEGGAIPVFEVPYGGKLITFISWCQKSGLRNAVLILLGGKRIKDAYEDEFRAVSLQQDSSY